MGAADLLRSVSQETVYGIGKWERNLPCYRRGVVCKIGEAGYTMASLLNRLPQYPTMVIGEKKVHGEHWNHHVRVNPSAFRASNYSLIRSTNSSNSQKRNSRFGSTIIAAKAGVMSASLGPAELR
jgi:hypothetical protein